MKGFTEHLRNIFRLGGRRSGYLPVELLFRYFKEVLEKNNEVLEIITDMGEKLGGDYLFDITYVKRAYSRLSSSLQDSLRTFDLLTRSRYIRLHNAYSRIDDRIKKMIYDISSSGEMVAFYRDITWDMGNEVGGKNSNLSEVKNFLRLNVPDAFAVTTLAYDAFMEHNGLDRRIALAGDSPDASRPEELREAVLKGEIPPALDAALDAALQELKEGCGPGCFLAVRSSAEEEDSDFSFAGQFETRLNVPCEGKALKEAYREVVASLFSPRALSYQKRLGYAPGSLKMAVGCMVMVEGTTSGVIYSTNPDGDRDTLVINAAWGLGSTVVEGSSDADLYVVRKGAGKEIVEKRLGGKERMTVLRRGGGTDVVETPEALRKDYALTAEQLRELSTQADLIERYFRGPRDIEWTIDRNGKVCILQTRPLRVGGSGGVSRPATQRVPDDGKTPSLISLRGKDILIQRGIGAGRVFVVRSPHDLDDFPRGAVLVAAHDSSEFVRVMPYVSAIITDVGTATSHMASLAREFRVPSIVNTGDATRILTDGQEVTLYADDAGTATLYDGIRKDLIDLAETRGGKMEELYEFRKKRYILRYVSPLNLIDPLLEDFSPEGCKTVHDIIRFIHEKSVAELVESSRYGKIRAKGHPPVRLDIPIPTGIMVIDIGGGLDATEKQESVVLGQITSVPFRAILSGMMHPGVWRSEAVSLRVNDFITSMIRMSDIVSEGKDYVNYNLAVVSREYVNLSLRFGYHFTTLDCYCSGNAKDNHIYFRFVGGATDLVKRSRRVTFIAAVLKGYGFNLKTKGDLVIARLANLGQEEIERILDRMGRLIAFTRQLDAVMHDDSTVDRFVRDFLEEKY